MATPRKSKPLPRDAADKAISSARMIAHALRRYAVRPQLIAKVEDAVASDRSH